ncbi:hypothetical protein ABH944_000026 [Caballeronia udeis]|uniref:DUF6538 domain-containing protein n=1 Tax=Caballeronia udeis TaxID=1232866 RepID=A0ABW8MB41_9BURK
MPSQFLQRSRHGTVFYFRRRVPSDISLVTGQQQVFKSLGTTDPRQAIIRARALAVQTDQLFAHIRSMPQGEWKGFNVGYTLKIELDGQSRPKALSIEAEPHEHEAVQKALETAMAGFAGLSSASPAAEPSLTLAQAVRDYLAGVTVKPLTLASYEHG